MNPPCGGFRKCCDTFASAFESGTDNECWGALASEWDNDCVIGSIWEPIKFCPWCGEKVIRAGNKQIIG